MNNPILLGGSLLPAQYQAFLTQSMDSFEITHRQLFNTQPFTTTQATPVPYFATVGSQNPAQISNVFPYSNHFIVLGLGFAPDMSMQTLDQGADGTGNVASFAKDIATILDAGLFGMSIGTKKQYGPWKLPRLQAGVGWNGAMAAAGAEAANLVTAAIMPGGLGPSNIYALSMPLLIPMQSNAGFSVSFPGGAIATSATRNLTLYLEGLELAPA